MNVKSRLLLVALIVLLQTFETFQNLIAQNYTTELLRLAKAAQTKAYMNEDVAPCRNFYKFACGNWGKIQPARLEGEVTTVLQQLEELYIRKSAEMLKADRQTDTTADIMLKQFFEACRDDESVKKISLEPLVNLVNFQGGWPKIESKSWYESEYDWLKTVADLRRKLGVNVLIGMEIIADFEDINTHRIMVGAPQLEFEREVYLQSGYSDKRNSYKETIERKLRLFYDNMSKNWASEVAQQVLDVEIQLAKGLSDKKDLTLKQISRLRSMADLRSAYGNYVDLSRYLNLIFNDTIYVQVYESPTNYMINLIEVIKHTPKLNIANYTMWRVLQHLDFAGEVNIEHNDIWCVQKTMEYFPQPLESLFDRSYNNIKLINEIQSVWADIKRTFREQLQTSAKLTWISQDTRQKAVQKLDAMELEFISHDSEDFTQRIQNLVLKKDKYYENLINVLEWQTHQQLAKLLEKPEPDEEDVKLPKYVHNRNKIVIPITFLQSRFFWDPAYPHSLKYSTIGVLLAQEMIHGFDADGHRYDSHGYQRSWWDSVSEYAFNEREQCFNKQYLSYKFQGKDLTGMETQSTTIADNGGLSIAYQAYLKWWENVANNENSATEKLPLLDYTQQQLFFLGFAQIWCADYHPSVEKFTEVPERLRVIGALANSVEFAKEYKCEMGNKMNPEKKCVIF